ncbi:hypothetical protein E2562_024923 [Oryza meyeriana var. granulata]|uniref:BTB domain-containing protein n=1 Tax=Oryza meyeriana var. granulata TaxID=110450 RepID=A0A6G1DMI7_9ORYZ|nr:hypothetical protein E2562_024923 [Oryza meyeriana var. granulata]
MLKEGIFTDITVNAGGGGGGIRAHRAVLAARSPVFMRMFSHDLREKELAMVDIPDMSLEACRAFVAYLYDDGGLSQEDLLAHRCELLAASDKYDIENLRALCEASFVADADAENVLERLEMAHMYRLRDLKLACLKLLFEFRKVKEIQEDFDGFVKTADEDLVAEITKFQKDFDELDKLKLKPDAEQIFTWDRLWIEVPFDLAVLYSWYYMHPYI